LEHSLQDSKDKNFESIVTYLRRSKYKEFGTNSLVLSNNNTQNRVNMNVFNKLNNLNSIILNKKFGTKRIYKNFKLSNPKLKMLNVSNFEKLRGFGISDIINQIKYGIRDFVTVDLIKNKIKLIYNYKLNQKIKKNKYIMTIKNNLTTSYNLKLNYIKKNIGMHFIYYNNKYLGGYILSNEVKTFIKKLSIQNKKNTTFSALIIPYSLSKYFKLKKIILKKKIFKNFIYSKTKNILNSLKNLKYKINYVIKEMDYTIDSYFLFKNIKILNSSVNILKNRNLVFSLNFLNKIPKTYNITLNIFNINHYINIINYFFFKKIINNFFNKSLLSLNKIFFISLKKKYIINNFPIKKIIKIKNKIIKNNGY